MKKPSSFDQAEDSLFSAFKQAGVPVSAELENSIKRKIQEMRTYTPKVGVFGKTGVGKSSLCNALFGQDVCSISDVKACTRNPQEVLLNLGGQGTGIKLIDVPGVGEDRQRDSEYDSLYKNLIPQLDLIFWVFKGDDRANASDQDFYERLMRPYIDAGKPFLAVVNQIDKVEPFREWNEKEAAPGIKQLKNIKEKCNHVANFLRLPVNQVIPVSANERYGLVELVDAIVHALPNEQRAIIVDTVQTADEMRAAAFAEETKRLEDITRRAQQALEDERRELERERRRIEASREARPHTYERSTVSEKTKKKAKHSTLEAVLDFVEEIPVVGKVVSFFRNFF